MADKTHQIIVVDSSGLVAHVVSLEGPRGVCEQFATDMAGEFNSLHIVELWDLGGELVKSVRGTIPPEWESLSVVQRRLHNDVEQKSGYDGSDTRDVLIGMNGSAKDKAAVADVFGGPGAGDDFRREHISMTSECRTCHLDGYFIDGIRDPYWVHENRAAGHAFTPKDSRTRRVFKRTGTSRRARS